MVPRDPTEVVSEGDALFIPEKRRRTARLSEDSKPGHVKAGKPATAVEAVHNAGLFLTCCSVDARNTKHLLTEIPLIHVGSDN